MSIAGVDASIGESDEEFARRLQAQEIGITLASPSHRQHRSSMSLFNGNYASIHVRQSGGHGSSPQTVSPLIHSPDPEINNQEDSIERDEDGNPTIIGSRINELATSRTTMNVLIVMTVPQVIAALVILPLYWNDKDTCSRENHNKWNWWAVLSTLRMFVYMVAVIIMHYKRDWIVENHRITQANYIRNVIDAAGFVWFLVGNVWVFSDEVDCPNPYKSPVYNLCVWMVIINYVQICLPCIIALCLIPFFCFCMPCLIRVLARLQQHQLAPKGATDTLINTLPVETITERLHESCPVCLNDMDVGEQVRNLPCQHKFHKECVDEWLRVNASCPTCRTSIIGNDDTFLIDEGSNSNNGNNNNNSEGRSRDSDSSNNNNNGSHYTVALVTDDLDSNDMRGIYNSVQDNTYRDGSVVNNGDVSVNNVEDGRNDFEMLGDLSDDHEIDVEGGNTDVEIAETPVSDGRIDSNRYRLL